MNIKEHFSKQEIKRLNKLPKAIKNSKWIIISASILMVVASVLNFRLAITIGHRYGINGFINVLAVWYRDIEAGKTYQWYEAVIAQRVATAHLYIGAVILFLVLYYVTHKNNHLLIKCWKLLSSANNNGQEKSDNNRLKD